MNAGTLQSVGLLNVCFGVSPGEHEYEILAARSKFKTLATHMSASEI